MLSLFPALFALLTLLGEHPRTTNALLDIVRDVGSPSAAQTFKGTIQEVIQDKGDAGALLAVGFLLAVWSASGYIGVFKRASNIVYEIPEERLFWERRPLQIAVAIAMVMLLSVVAIAIMLTGRFAEAVGGVIGLDDEAVTIWSIARRPVLVVVVIALIALLYYTAPNVRQRGFASSFPAGRWRWSSGSPHRSPSAHTLRISAPITRPTALSEQSLCFSYGSTFPTTPCCWVLSSMPDWSAGAS
jgi:membrane protein